MLGQEPLLWRGAYMARFPKKGSAAETCASHRSVGLGTIAGKAYHTCLRARMLEHVSTASRATQCGGLHGKSTDFAAHMLLTVVRASALKRTSCAVVFLDMVSASYKLVREQLLPVVTSVRDWQAYLHQVGWDDARIAAFCSRCAGHDQPSARGGVMGRACSDEHLVGLASFSHSATWYSLPGDSATYHYLRGVRSGRSVRRLGLYCLDDRGSRRARERAGGRRRARHGGRCALPPHCVVVR